MSAPVILFGATLSAFHRMVKLVMRALLGISGPAACSEPGAGRIASESGSPALAKGDDEFECYTLGCDAVHRQTLIVSAMKSIWLLREELNSKCNIH
ncbi:hypothetical protein [Ruegeria arenilitoris]|uniref:hypothetical protein n=1 Tax=Ruegeria arenilitoris TaxID=1173585 RepID=UPI00147F0B5C|nr:hypothetical protein [Ruegeria arenilitoris]